jgi:hypothetical protein
VILTTAVDSFVLDNGEWNTSVEFKLSVFFKDIFVLYVLEIVSFKEAPAEKSCT